MFHVYVLFSKKDNGLYFGRTRDLKRRYQEHQNGEAKGTKGRRPLVLIYCESFLYEKEAIKREEEIKKEL